LVGAHSLDKVRCLEVFLETIAITRRCFLMIGSIFMKGVLIDLSLGALVL
jgi:hypothetical protein